MATLSTFKDLKNQALLLLDQQGDLGSGSIGDQQVAAAIAMAHNKRLTSQRWSFMLWPNPIKFSFVTGVQVYTLHPRAQMLTEFWNTGAGQIMKEVPTRARYKSGTEFVDLTAQTGGDRFRFEFVQDSPIQLPFAEGKLQITSGGATLYYIDTNGNDTTDVLTNGQFTSANVDTVYGVTKTDLTQLLTITDSANTVVLNSPANQVPVPYRQIRLFGPGANNETAQYRFYRKPRYLSADNDLPEIPFPFNHILVYDALLELYTYNDYTPPEYWLKQQKDWEDQLNQTFQEGEMEGAEVRQVNETDLYQG